MKYLIQFWNKYKKANIFVLKILLFAILVYNVSSKFTGKEFENALTVFKSQFSFSKIHFLLIAIFFTFFNWGFETLKYYICIQKVEKISFWTAYRGILYGNAMNLILPASIGELTGRPLVLKEENRAEGSGVAYYVSIVQKVASPIVGLSFLALAAFLNILQIQYFEIVGFQINIIQIVLFISLLDLSFWFFLFYKPYIVLHLLEKINYFKQIFEKIEKALNIKQSTKLKLIVIGCIRFLIFVTQYWILMFMFFDNFPYLNFYILCGVYFLAQFVIPSLGFLDLGIRANLVALIFGLYMQNFLQLMAVNYLIWIINVLIPSLFGFYLMRGKIIKT